MMEHKPTTEELRFLADRALAQDDDHIEIAEGKSLDWLIAQLANFPVRVDEDCTMNLRYLMMSAASTLRVLRDAETKFIVACGSAGVAPNPEFDNEAEARARYHEELSIPSYMGPNHKRRAALYRRTVSVEELARV